MSDKKPKTIKLEYTGTFHCKKWVETYLGSRKTNILKTYKVTGKFLLLENRKQWDVYPSKRKPYRKENIFYDKNCKIPVPKSRLHRQEIYKNLQEIIEDWEEETQYKYNKRGNIRRGYQKDLNTLNHYKSFLRYFCNTIDFILS